MTNERKDGGQGRWTEDDQNKAAEKGQGAEIGGTHGAGSDEGRTAEDASRPSKDADER